MMFGPWAKYYRGRPHRPSSRIGGKNPLASNRGPPRLLLQLLLELLPAYEELSRAQSVDAKVRVVARFPKIIATRGQFGISTHDLTELVETLEIEHLHCSLKRRRGATHLCLCLSVPVLASVSVPPPPALGPLGRPGRPPFGFRLGSGFAALLWACPRLAVVFGWLGLVGGFAGVWVWCLGSGWRFSGSSWLYVPVRFILWCCSLCYLFIHHPMQPFLGLKGACLPSA